MRWLLAGSVICFHACNSPYGEPIRTARGARLTVGSSTLPARAVCSSIAEGQAALAQGVAEDLHGVRPHAVQPHDVGLGDLGKVLKAGVAAPCSARRAGAAILGR